MVVNIKVKLSSLRTQTKQWPVLVVIMLATLPIIIAMVYVIKGQLSRHEMEAFMQKDMAAFMAADVLREKFDHIVDVGSVLAERDFFQGLVKSGQWNDALVSTERITRGFPYISLVSLFDTEGTLQADSSGDMSLVGKNFSYRDYYQGVSKNWEPYVSDVFKKTGTPAYTMVSIAVPIHQDSKILGVLVLSVHVELLAEWIKGIDAGPEGFAYLVDRKGNLLAHQHLFVNDVMSYALVPVVQKVLKGERGAEIFFDPVEKSNQVVGYVPVAKYGFGAVAVPPAHAAFAGRNREITETVFVWGIIILGVFAFTLVILRSRKVFRQQHDWDETLLDSIGDGVVAIDQDRNITLWNRAAAVITGWTAAEAIGKPYREVLKFMRERDRIENSAFVEEALGLSKVISLVEKTLLVRKDGTEVPTGNSAAAIRNNQDKVVGGIIIFRDISEERESAHLRSDFMYATHQLRTPVTEAIWNLETAMVAQTLETRQEYMGIAHNALLSIRELSEELVEVSEIDQGAIAVKTSDVKLADIFTEIEHILEFKMKAHKVTLAIDHSSAPVTIKVNPKMLKKVLIEVLENAVIYSRENTEAKVVVVTQENNLLIEVTDTGVGITEEEQPIIFTKFFRGSNRPPESAGAGLGLFIAKEYVKLLGGKIWFTSEQGKGTTFYISVPIK